MKNDPALHSIMDALDGDIALLVSRLESGDASTAELKLAADLIKKIKLRRPRSGSSRYNRFLIVQDFLLLKKLLPNVPLGIITEVTAKQHGVSKRHVDAARAEFDGVAILTDSDQA
jgi:hypothetical protein